jgi:hypothetical protein
MRIKEGPGQRGDVRPLYAVLPSFHHSDDFYEVETTSFQLTGAASTTASCIPAKQTPAMFAANPVPSKAAPPWGAEKHLVCGRL